MNVTTAPMDDNPFEAGFRAFYEELEQVLLRPVDGNPEDPAAVEQHVRQVQRHLQSFLELQDMQSKRGEYRAAAALVDQVRYLKTAIADEVLLSKDWPGRALWQKYLLEAALFRSSVAGDKVLDDIEKMLSEREPAMRPLAQLQLFMLALGFQGRLRGRSDLKPLRELRQELYQFVYQRRAGAEDGARPLSPQAYANTLSHLAPKRQRRLSRWSLFWWIGMLALLMFSELMWLWPTWPLRQALDKVGQTQMESSR